MLHKQRFFRYLFWTSLTGLVLTVSGIIDVVNLTINPAAVAPVALADGYGIKEAPGVLAPQNFQVSGQKSADGKSVKVTLSWQPPKEINVRINDVGCWAALPISFPPTVGPVPNMLDKYYLNNYTVWKTSSENPTKADEPWAGKLNNSAELVTDTVIVSPDHDIHIKYTINATFVTTLFCYQGFFPPVYYPRIDTNPMSRNITIAKDGKVTANDNSTAFEDHRPNQLTADWAWDDQSNNGWNVTLAWKQPPVAPDMVPPYYLVARQRQIKDGAQPGAWGRWFSVNKNVGVDRLSGIHQVSKPDKGSRWELEYMVRANYKDQSYGDIYSNVASVTLRLGDDGKPPTDSQAGHSEGTAPAPDRVEVLNSSTIEERPTNLETCNCDRQADDPNHYNPLTAAIDRAICVSICTVSRALGILACFLIGNIVDPIFNRFNSTCDSNNIDNSAPAVTLNAGSAAATNPSSSPNTSASQPAATSSPGMGAQSSGGQNSSSQSGSGQTSTGTGSFDGSNGGFGL